MNNLAMVKKQIMRRVYLIWFFRTIFSGVTVKLAAIAALAWQLTSYVSIGQVIANWNFDGGISTSYAFLESAFAHTEFTTLALLFGIVALALLLMKDTLVRDYSAKQLFVRI